MTRRTKTKRGSLGGMVDPQDPRTQAEKFADLARELECDEDEAAFDERLKKLPASNPAPKTPKEDGE